MHARSITLMARPDSIDTGVAFIRDEVMPMLLDMEGCIGLSMLVDRNSGRCITTSSWEDLDSMHATDERLRESRRRAAELMGGGDLQAEEWEIAAMHRDHPSQQGACVRVTWVQTSPQQLDGTIEFWKSTILPAMEAYDGFCSASLLVDRQSGRAASSVTFDSREAMDATRDKAENLRRRGVQEAGVELLEVGEFELALAHLRVPEMA